MRFMTFPLLGLLALTLSSFAPADAAEAVSIEIATFESDMTPPLGRGIYSGYQPLAEIETPLLAKGIVLDDGENRYVLCAVDHCELNGESHQTVRRALAEGAGTTVDRVALHTVHQHTAPIFDIAGVRILTKADPSLKIWDPAFLVEKAGQLKQTVAQACKQMQKVDSLGLGQAKVDRVAATRRVKNEDGSITIRWSSCGDPALRAQPEGLIDPILKTITFAQGNKPIARLHYYATHPQSFYGDPRASWDVPGMARERLQKEEGVHEIYFTGCAGDVTMGKYNDRSREARTELAGRLYEGMKASAESTEYQPIGPIQWRVVDLPLPIKKFDVEKLKATIADKEKHIAARLDAAQELATIQRGGDRYYLSCLSIGKMHILHAPGESSIVYQKFAQSLLPDDFVAMAAYGDCGIGYFVCDEHFEEGGYEPGQTDCLPGAEKVMKDQMRQILVGSDSK